MNALLPIFLAVAVPAVISAMVLLVGWFSARHGPSAALPRWSVPAAIGSGYAAGHFSLSGWPHLPPTDVTHWLPFIALLGLALALTIQWKQHVAAISIGRLVIAVVSCYLVLMPLIKSSAAAVALPGIAALLAQLAWFWSADILERRFAAWEYLLALLILSVGVSFALVLARSALLGQVAGALGAAFGPLLVATVLLRRRDFVLRTTSWIWVPVLIGLLLIGNQYASLAKVPTMMLAAVPVLMAGVAAVPRGTTPASLRWGAIVLAVAIILAALLIITRELPPIEMSEF